MSDVTLVHTKYLSVRWLQ